MVVGFIWWWPVGLALLAYLLGSGRLGRCCGPGRWHTMAARRQRRAAGRRRVVALGLAAAGAAANRRPAATAAFDEYRAETLRRLEEEQREFLAYLERLRRARDKAEFDQFMDERRQGPGPAPAPEAT